MSDLNQFERLVAQARLETAPVVDVADRVLTTVRVVRPAPVERVDRAAILFTAASVLAASIVAMIAWQLVETPMVAEVPNPFVVPVMAPQ